MHFKLAAGPGEIWALTGDSASGHSELLRTQLNNDSAWVSFRHPFRNRSNTTDLYYQQRYNSYDAEDSLTVREYLEQATALLPADPQRLAHIESVLDLAPLLDEQLIKLSNGETRKVLIAEAWAKMPRTLLLDHPFTGLDVRSRSMLPSILKEIAASGASILLATDPFEVPEVVDKVAIVRNGSLEQVIDRKDYKLVVDDLQTEIPLDREALSMLLAERRASSFQTIIRLKDVNITYQGHRILEGINWEVQPGERWALTGPNGAGKSTLLSLVVGDNPQAYANDITLFDRRRGSGESIWDIKRHTGFVSPEFYQYFPTQTLCLHAIESGFFDTVGLFRSSDPVLEAICRSWMKLMGIESQAWKPLSQVKPDVQRLCLLARALVKNPTLLVLDEPTQGLDATQQRFFVKLVDAICERSDVTLVYVSHYREHIPHAVTRELMLENGRIARP
jgi:molybdate transport system ATP-binding protein